MANAAATVQAPQKAKKKSEFVRVMKQMSKNKLAMIGLAIFIVEVVLVVLAPWIIPYDYTKMDMTACFATPSMKHLFGCDDLGRDGGVVAAFIRGEGEPLILAGNDVLRIQMGQRQRLHVGKAAAARADAHEMGKLRRLFIYQRLHHIDVSILIAFVLGPRTAGRRGGRRRLGGCGGNF